MIELEWNLIFSPKNHLPNVNLQHGANVVPFFKFRNPMESSPDEGCALQRSSAATAEPTCWCRASRRWVCLWVNFRGAHNAYFAHDSSTLA
jgi:hypothetical protein